MAYSRWANDEEIKERLAQVNFNSDVKKSGIPMMYDENNLYIKDDEAHSIVISAPGSGKMQTTILPNLRLAIKAEESFVLYDTNGEVFETLGGELNKLNYNVIVIDLEKQDYGNHYNPLMLPYKLYKEGKKNKAVDLLENVGYYVCTSENKSQDPFWENSAISLFVGLSLYLFDNAKEKEINLNSVVTLADELKTIAEKLDSMNKQSLSYMNLATILKAPPETKGSILSVFKQSIKLFTSREGLSKLMSMSDFDIENIQKEKSTLFIIGENKAYVRRLVSLIVNQVYIANASKANNSRRLNVLVDEFDNLFPIKELNNILTNSRKYNIRFNVYIKSIHELNRIYGKENTMILDYGNIIYLYSNDIEAMEKISNYCGKKSEKELLVSIEDLKLLDRFEAIILVPRMYPIKTKLLPDYQINWNFSEEKAEPKKFDDVKVEIYNI